MYTFIQYEYIPFNAVYLHANISTCIQHIYVHAFIQTYIDRQMDSCMSVYIYTYKYMCIPSWLYTYIHIYMSAYIHITGNHSVMSMIVYQGISHLPYMLWSCIIIMCSFVANNSDSGAICLTTKMAYVSSICNCSMVACSHIFFPEIPLLILLLSCNALKMLCSFEWEVPPDRSVLSKNIPGVNINCTSLEMDF